MDHPGWKNQSTDRLHHDKCKTTKHSTQSAEQHLLEWKHESEPAAPSTDNATLLQRGKEIQKTIPTETGKKLRYDVKELREHPERLTRAYNEHEERNPTQEQQNQDWTEWETYQKTLGKLLEKNLSA